MFLSPGAIISRVQVSSGPLQMKVFINDLHARVQVQAGVKGDLL